MSSRPLWRSLAPGRRIAAGLALAAAVLLPMAAGAGEGAGSHYMPGVSGDFAMALIGPPGVYLRSDLAWFQGRIDEVTLGDRVYTQASQSVWVDVTKLIWLAPGGILGGRFGALASIPVVIDATARGSLVEPVAQRRSGSLAGFGDVSFTAFLNWERGRGHLTGGFTLYTPVGRYDPDRIVNLGRNYWSIAPMAALTWLDPGSGREASLTTSVFFNTANGATSYRSGNEWTMDFLLGQHLSESLALAAEGSALVGLTDDSGAFLDRTNATLEQLGLASLGGFRARYLGLGPAVLWRPHVFGRDVSLIGKYLFDVVHENRFNSRFLVLSLAFAF